MKYIILFSLLLVGCDRPLDQVGKTEVEYDVQCVKSVMQPGFNTNGDFHMTSQCIASVCVRRVIKLGKQYGRVEELHKSVVEMAECLK